MQTDSRRPCPEECAQCCRVEAKDKTAVEEGEPQCQALCLEDTADWAKEQREDPEVYRVIQWIEQGRRPEWPEVVLCSPSVRLMRSQLEGLKLDNGVLRRRWLEPAT